MTVGQAIKKARRAKGLTQCELAKMIETNSTTVCMWEADQYYPSLFLLMCAADVLEVSLDELVGRIDEESEEEICSEEKSPEEAASEEECLASEELISDLEEEYSEEI